jgi:lipoprotein-anchoring transpeptidase ErfK/SrfK
MLFSKRFASLFLLSLFVVLLSPPSAFAQPAFVLRPSSFVFRPASVVRPPSSDPLPALCPTNYQLQYPADCPEAGPVKYATRLMAAGLPYPLPSPLVTKVHPHRGLTPDAYERVITDTAPVYHHPLEALAGLPPVRTLEKGFVFVSVIGTINLQDQIFYEINQGEYMRAEDLKEALPSAFQGMHLGAPPVNAVGWVITRVQPSVTPGAPPNPEAAYAGRYQSFQVYGVQRVGDWDWYLIGPNQWVEQRNLALVQPTPPAGAPGNVIAVDTYEETLGVYQNGQLIFATLVSSGSRYFPTRPGTFKVWGKLTHGKMSGAYLPDRRDYYFLEDVPWILYYDGDRALHGAYWHDNFGIKSSHGCVNLSPKDARWLYDYANVGSTVFIYSSSP